MFTGFIFAPSVYRWSHFTSATLGNVHLTCARVCAISRFTRFLEMRRLMRCSFNLFRTEKSGPAKRLPFEKMAFSRARLSISPKDRCQRVEKEPAVNVEIERFAKMDTACSTHREFPKLSFQVRREERVIASRARTFNFAELCNFSRSHGRVRTAILVDQALIRSRIQSMIYSEIAEC